MAKPVNGQAQGPTTVVVLKLINVPERGEITVRFLGELKGTMTHFVPGRPKGRSHACTEEDCPASVHKIKAVWKGYVPAEVWRVNEQDWFPGVLEITEALGQSVKDRRLVGEMWELQRCKGEFKHDEVVGTFLAADRPPMVDTTDWVDTVCFRLYHTREIRWGACDPLPNRVRLETRKAPPPPKTPAAVPQNPTPQERLAAADPEIMQRLKALRGTF